MAEFDEEDPRRPVRGKTSGAAFRGSSGRVRRRGGRGRTCGALGGVGEARGGWWPRRTASVATAPFGPRCGARGRAGEGDEHGRELTEA